MGKDRLLNIDEVRKQYDLEPEDEDEFKENDEVYDLIEDEESSRTNEDGDDFFGYGSDVFIERAEDIPIDELPDMDFEQLVKTRNEQEAPEEKGNSIAYELFKRLCSRYYFRCWNGQMYVYNQEQGRFIHHNENKLKVLIREGWDEKIQAKLSKYVVAEIVERLITEPSFQVEDGYFNCYEYLMNFKNGVLNLYSDEFLEHLPEYRFTHLIHADYHPKPEGGQIFMKFIKTAMQGDLEKERQLQEKTGYMLSEFHRAKKVPVLTGARHSGKSTIDNLITALIGPDQVSHVPLHKLHERFVAAHLSTKKANVCSEISDEAFSNIMEFKAITGNDEITAEYKGKDHFSYRSKIKLMFSGNTVPKLKNSDVTSAFIDRLSFLVFNYTVPVEDRDYELEEKMLAHDRSYIVSWAVEGVKRLMENNFVFSESKESVEFKQRYTMEQNNTLDFVNSDCVLGEGGKVHMRDLYDAYTRYCYQNCFNPKDKSDFFAEIEKHGIKKEKFRIDQKSLWGYKGIRLNVNAIVRKDTKVNEQQENLEHLEQGA